MCIRDRRSEVVEELRSQIQILWHTDEVRSSKPQVRDEVKNGLYYFRESIFQALPLLYRHLERGLNAVNGEEGGKAAVQIPGLRRFGSWIGGDRDGNPFVTAETMRQATGRNAAAALGHYIDAVHGLGAELSVSASLAAVPEAVEALAEASGDEAPSRRDEPYRRALSGIYARLCATYAEIVGRAPPRPSALSGAPYATPADFRRDLVTVSYYTSRCV